MSGIKPFRIAVPQLQLDQLHSKLSQATLPAETSFSNDWKYGVPLADIRRLVSYWKDSYDWRKHEAELNELPHFTTTISVDGFEDLEIHFIHQKSNNPDAIPLLFCHGWPGGWWEARKILPLLTNGKDNEQSFHLVVPSHPNFGFSQGVSKPEFGIPQYAETVHRLMLQLGYKKYATQGGDWGFRITRMLDLLYPSSIVASHLNFIDPVPPTLTSHPILYLRSLLSMKPLTAAEKARLSNTQLLAGDGWGYNLQQSTKPHTIGFALADSPVGLLAWILDKLHDWTDNYPWTDDEVLTWVSLYLFSRAGADASARIYYECLHRSTGQPLEEKTLVTKSREWNGRVKLGLSYFPKEIVLVRKLWGRAMGPVVFERVHRIGGHFAAWECPEALVGDLREMFKVDGLLGREWVKINPQ